ncbi:MULTISPECIES: reductive dehalogenase [Dehalobacter]|uniref:Reductive dehalogenase n=2 Tax=Bacteria TaxID=2 RepID=A0A857DH28_9FIRM|nr:MULTISPECIES: reductive dehalogenase [Dehalobacter]MCG1025879.1 reductive dehalogenase [Dehalobacter sp.]OCZ52096.1 reductive dehalogenase [Dehalobacter sp. TeCB1]QGZ99927.1 reductive dehalogenase [Dehalobacter restrictus]
MEEKKINLSRRGFLKAGVAAAAAGVIGAINPDVLKAENASLVSLDYASPANGNWSKLVPKMNYGGASVRYAEHNDQWLGTSQIVGEVQNISEYDNGFTMAIRGELGEIPRWNYVTQGKRDPMASGLGFAISFLSTDKAVEGPAPPRAEKLPVPDPEIMSKHIKDTCYYLRADEVGIGKMPAYAYYSHRISPTHGDYATGKIDPNLLMEEIPVTERLPYVICVAVEQHLETWLASTGYDGIAKSQSYRAYHATANITVMLAQYIRSLGYRARAHHFANYASVMGPILIACGMGELTRTGDCVAHPRMGFRNKVAAVTTDLPLVPDKPIDFGMLDFCRVCRKCSENCPGEAISFDEEPVKYNGYLRWNSDFRKCAAFRTGNQEGFSCGRCVKVCPWSSKEDSWFHEAGVWIGSKGKQSASLLKQIDDMFGYGTEEITKYKWWLEWPELFPMPAGYPPTQTTQPSK